MVRIARLFLDGCHHDGVEKIANLEGDGPDIGRLRKEAREICATVMSGVDDIITKAVRTAVANRSGNGFRGTIVPPPAVSMAVARRFPHQPQDPRMARIVSSVVTRSGVSTMSAFGAGNGEARADDLVVIPFSHKKGLNGGLSSCIPVTSECSGHALCHGRDKPGHRRHEVIDGTDLCWSDQPPSLHCGNVTCTQSLMRGDVTPRARHPAGR